MSTPQLGIQLFTVREACGADFKGTLRALAGMGYQGVEFAGNYGGMKPDELAAFLRNVNLRPAGMHVSLADIADPQSDSYRYARAIGSAYVTTSLCGEVQKDWKGIVAQMIQAAAVAKSRGVVFTYHNHAEEFEKVDGVYALDYAFTHSAGSALQFEPDTYWIRKGGEDPVPYLRKFKGRAPQIHLKDMDRNDGSFTEVGNGLMDLPAIFAAGREIGTRWIIVEQDACKRPAIESARISARNLKTMGLV